MMMMMMIMMSDCRAANADCGVPTADCRVPHAGCRVDNTNCRAPSADCGVIPFRIMVDEPRVRVDFNNYLQESHAGNATAEIMGLSMFTASLNM